MNVPPSVPPYPACATAHAASLDGAPPYHAEPQHAGAPALLQAVRATAIFAAMFARGAVRGRILWVAAVTATCGLLLAALAGEGAVTASARIVTDFTLVTLQLAGSGVAIAAAVGGFAGDEAGRLGYTWLARPVPRAALLLGRFFGLWGVLTALVALMGGAGACTVWAFGGALPAGYAAAVAMGVIELGLLTACALLLATLCAPPLAAAAAVVVLMAGNFSTDLLALAEAAPSGGFVMRLAYRLLPDFYHLSMRPWAAADTAPPWPLLLHAACYGLCYLATVLTLAALAYGRRATL